MAGRAARLAGPEVARSSAERGRPWPGPRTYLAAAMAVAALIAYASLVPFDLRRPPHRPGAWLAQVHCTGWGLASRTDLLVNVLAGGPLGFFLMGALRTSRFRCAGVLLPALLVGCAAALLATLVELLQVLSITRTASWNDVLGQVAGAGLGLLAWLAAGPGVTTWLGRLAHERAPTDLAIRLLSLYLPVYGIAQLLPFDVAIRPAELLAKYRAGRITLVPWSSPFDSASLAVRDVMGDLLLNVPIGVLAVLGGIRPGTRRPIVAALLAGGAVVAAIEFGTIGAVAGIAAAQAVASRGGRR